MIKDESINEIIASNKNCIVLLNKADCVNEKITEVKLNSGEKIECYSVSFTSDSRNKTIELLEKLISPKIKETSVS